MLIMFKLKIKITHDVASIRAKHNFNKMKCIMLLNSTMLLFGGWYTTRTMYVWPSRWSFANIYWTWLSAMSSSQSCVHAHFLPYAVTHRLRSHSWLIQHACIHLCRKCQVRMDTNMFKRSRLLKTQIDDTHYSTQYLTGWQGDFGYLCVIYIHIYIYI